VLVREAGAAPGAAKVATDSSVVATFFATNVTEQTPEGNFIIMGLSGEPGFINYKLCVFSDAEMLVCTDYEYGAQWFTFKLTVCPWTCRVKSLDLVQLLGHNTNSRGNVFPLVGMGQFYDPDSEGEPSSTSSSLVHMSTVAGTMESAGIFCKYPSMDGASYPLTFKEMFGLTTDASPDDVNFRTYDTTIAFFNQTDSETGDRSSQGQYVQMSNGELYFLCMFLTGTTDLSCTDARNGSSFLFVTVTMNKVTCKPKAISTVTYYGYVGAEQESVRRSFVSFAVSGDMVAKPRVPPSIEGLEFTVAISVLKAGPKKVPMLMSGIVADEPVTHIYSADLPLNFFNQANGDGEQDSRGVFVQLLSNSRAQFFCIFMDCEHLACVKDGRRGRVYFNYKFPWTGMGKTVIGEYRWGEGLQARVAFARKASVKP